MKLVGKPIYSNDRTAPRMSKAKYTTHIVTKELWKEFRIKYPEYKEKTDKELNEKWGDIAQTIREELVTNPLGVKLGSYTGELKLQYLSKDFEAIDPSTSVELAEKVKHTNIVTKGKTATIKWERRWAVKFNKMLQFFAFDNDRKINELAKDYVRSNPERLRAARSTLGGFSIWRQLKKKFNDK